jgi:hypothetical protein
MTPDPADSIDPFAPGGEQDDERRSELNARAYKHAEKMVAHQRPYGPYGDRLLKAMKTGSPELIETLIDDLEQRKDRTWDVLAAAPHFREDVEINNRATALLMIHHNKQATATLRAFLNSD